MRAAALLLVLVCSILTPMVSAIDSTNTSDSEVVQSEAIIDGYSPALQAALLQKSNLDSYSVQELNSAHQWVVISHAEQGQPAGELEGAWIVDVQPFDAPEMFEQQILNGEIEMAYPLVQNQMLPRWVPNDPKFPDQWHLQNTGQTSGVSGEDVNITGAWNAYKGTGIVIGIVDDGLDWSHPDLDDYYEPTLDYDYCQDDGDPSPASNKAHGTASAGVAAGVGDNNLGVSGSAPMAGLAGLKLIACSTTDIRESSALGHERQDIDIYSNSWGPSDDGETLEGPGPLMMAAMENDALLGRGGLGNIITWAAGNGLDDNDNSNYDGYANLRYTIAVTAVTHYGVQSYYAEPGANILVASPSNGDGEGITTTDNQGSGGYTANDYTDTFGGTSSATPLVSGVIALMLEANANLTWRDVQHILVHTSRQNDASTSVTSWATNGAGHDVSHKYGFGVVDAGAAVTLSETWTNVNDETSATTGTLSCSQCNIPDNNANLVTVNTMVSEPIRAENVDVIVDITHQSRGDLEVVLTSPSGTQSVLSEKHNDGGADYNNWRFSTVHNWDEDCRGEWTLTVEDKKSGNVGTLDSWELVLYGTELDIDSDGDNLTNFNESNVYGTDPNDYDSDDDTIGDGDEVLVYGTNPLLDDTDGDGLSDGVEIFVNGTDPLMADTDGDLLNDGAEVLIHGTDPLVADPNLDADGYYWFDDCNDTNPMVYPGAAELLNGIDDNCDGQWDEGFNITDTDNDGLSDFAEYHIFGTSVTIADTDGDLLIDGLEILTYSSDPLVRDNDTDMDGFYWFQDCNDTNADVSPSALELLDSIDNDCDGDTDEDFIGTDADDDGILDLVEFLELNTNPFDNDTDADGLNDGLEVFTTFSNPNVYDADADNDGFYWFSDCDDNSSLRYPGATEIWNGLDDDCDDAIDEQVDKESFILSVPSAPYVIINATSENLNLGVSFNMTEESVARLNLTVQWFYNQTLLDEGTTLNQPVFNCQNQITPMAEELCTYNGTAGPYEYKAVVFEENGYFETTWMVYYSVWNPPAPEETNPTTTTDMNDGNSDSPFEEYMIPLVLCAVVVLLLLVLLFIRRGPKQPPYRPKQSPQGFDSLPMPPMYADVQAAPSLSQYGRPGSQGNTQTNQNRWK